MHVAAGLHYPVLFTANKASSSSAVPLAPTAQRQDKVQYRAALNIVIARLSTRQALGLLWA